MQRLLQDTGIMTKILAMMLMLGVVAKLRAGVNAWKIRNVEARYSYLIKQEMSAVPLLVRSLRQLNEGLFNGLQLSSARRRSRRAMPSADDWQTSAY